MKTTTFTLLASLLIWANINAQSFSWAKSVGGNDDDIAYSITCDNSGNVYVTGDFYGTVDFDPGSGVYNLTSSGWEDIFIQKLDSAGNFLWAKSIGGGYFDAGTSINTDDAGNIYIVGAFGQSVDFNPGNGVYNLTSVGNDDIFILKLNSAGNFVWAKSIGGSDFDTGISISIDKLGNIYVTGIYKDTADFDPGSGTFNLSSNGDEDIFMLKLDSAGNFVWAKSIGGSDFDAGGSIKVDNAGSVYITGGFSGTVDFDPGSGQYNLSSAGDQDAFVLKIDSAGNFVWARSLGGSDDDESYSLIIDKKGNIYTAGMFEGTVDFDPGSGVFNLTSAGNWDIFVQKLDNSGNFVWAKSMGGSDDDMVNGIVGDKDGNIYFVGEFLGTMDFDPSGGVFNLTSAGNEDVFLEKLDSAGNFVWANKMGGNDYDEGNCIALDKAGNVYIAGSYEGVADFNPGSGIFNLSSKGLSDIFVEKFNARPVNISRSKTLPFTLSLFPNPNEGDFTLEISTKDNKAGNFNLEIYSALGKLIHSESLTINGSLVKPMHFDKLSKGVYFIRLQNNTGVYNARFVVD